MPFLFIVTALLVAPYITLNINDTQWLSDVADVSESQLIVLGGVTSPSL
jgi:hypothetical protein